MLTISPWMLVGGAALATAAIGAQTMRLVSEQSAHLATKLEYSKQQKDAANVYIETVDEYRKRESKWAAAITSADIDGAARLAAAGDAADRLAAERDGLRDQYRRALVAQASAAACPAADAADGQAAADAANLHADLFGKLDARASALAAIADAQHASAVTCWNAASVGRWVGTLSQ